MNNKTLSRYTAALVTVYGAALYAQAPIALANSDHRPLVGILDKIESTTGTPINYEDVPYEHASDLQDVSTPQQRAAYPGYKLLVPRKGDISVALQLAPTFSPADQLFNLNSLLDSYRNNQLPGDYRVEQANGMTYIVPAKVLASSGTWRAVISPMTTLISVPYAERSSVETVAEVLVAISKAAGVRIDLGALPVYPATTIAFGASQEPARDVLAKAFTKISSTPISYRLLYDPMDKAYMLNAQLVFTRGHSIVPASPSTPVPQVEPAINPFFTKQN